MHDDGQELYEKSHFIVDKGQDLLRIDKFLMLRMNGMSRHRIQQYIRGNLVLVNSQPTKNNYRVKPLDNITLWSPVASEYDGEIVPTAMPLDIIYEDNDVLVINKAAGLVVHPGCGHYDDTMLNGMAYYFNQNKETISEDILPRLGLVHRIDKNTSGILVLGKTMAAIKGLIEQFAAHRIHRKYIALVWGNMKQEQGTINIHVGRHQRFRKIFDAYPDGNLGKHAITHYKVIERFNYVTLLECSLETGRTHQIRVHMQHIGHPLFNDDSYGGHKIVKGTIYKNYQTFVHQCFDLFPRHALHAKELGFVHPITKESLFFSQPLPDDFVQLLNKWSNWMKKL